MQIYICEIVDSPSKIETVSFVPTLKVINLYYRFYMTRIIIYKHLGQKPITSHKSQHTIQKTIHIIYIKSTLKRSIFTRTHSDRQLISFRSIGMSLQNVRRALSLYWFNSRTHCLRIIYWLLYLVDRYWSWRSARESIFPRFYCNIKQH